MAVGVACNAGICSSFGDENMRFRCGVIPWVLLDITRWFLSNRTGKVWGGQLWGMSSSRTAPAQQR